MEKTCANCKSTIKSVNDGIYRRCRCGWSEQQNLQKLEKRQQLNRALLLFSIAITVISAMSLSLFLSTPHGQMEMYKLRQQLGLNQHSQHIAQAKLCQYLEKTDCAVKAFEKALVDKPEQPESLLEIARIHRQTGNIDAAMERYFEYLENPHANIDSMVEIAETLNGIGRVEQAIKMFEQSLEDVDGMININAAKGLVRLYISIGEKKKALQAIRDFHDKTRSAQEFFKAEIRTLRRM